MKKIELIGEIGTNHNGKIETAIELIDMAAATGLDTVKFQVYDANDIVSPKVKTSHYGITSQYEYWQDYINAKLITPKAWLPELVAHAKEKGMDAIATPHSMSNAEACLKAGMTRLKIASMDCNYYPFIADLCTLKVPLLLSTGMSTIDEIYKSVSIIKKNNVSLTLFHCVATYPTKYEEANMSFLQTLKDFEPDHLGFSDHSGDNDLIMVAIPYGIDVVEKHITLDKTQDGPDHPFALNPDECELWRKKVDNATACLGSTDKQLSIREINNRKKYRRVAIMNKDLHKGDVFTSNDFYFARPADVNDSFITPELVTSYFGYTLCRDIESGDGLTEKHFVK